MLAAAGKLRCFRRTAVVRPFLLPEVRWQSLAGSEARSLHWLKRSVTRPIWHAQASWGARPAAPAAHQCLSFPERLVRPGCLGVGRTRCAACVRTGVGSAHRLLGRRRAERGAAATLLAATIEAVS